MDHSMLNLDIGSHRTDPGHEINRSSSIVQPPGSGIRATPSRASKANTKLARN